MAAKRPVIYAGGGVILGKASSQLTELTRTLGFPITNTLMGIGCYPATDKQHLAGWVCTVPMKPTWRCTIQI